MLEELIYIFSNFGIYVDKNELDEPLDIDSIIYMQVLIELEEDMGVSIEDEFLLGNDYLTLRNILTAIDCSKKKK